MAYHNVSDFLHRHSGKECRNPGPRGVMGGVHPAFWMPAIHAGMTDWEWIDGIALWGLIQVFDFTPIAKMRIAGTYLYRAVDKAGQTIEFLLTAHRDRKAALRFFKKAVRQHGLPEKVTTDKSGANTAALETLIEETAAEIEIRQTKYLNNLVEPDHRAVKRIVRPLLGFKSFGSARVTLQGIELMHMIKKGQMITVEGQSLSAAEQFYSLAA